MDRLLALSDTPFINAHLAPFTPDFPGVAMNTRDPADRTRLTDAMIRDAAALVGRFGREKVILENVMWDPRPRWQIPAPVLETEVIRRVVEEADCGFLFDLAHAVISARYLGEDEADYIAALPLERMREMHVSGIVREDNGLWMDHYAMTDDDWRRTAWALERIRGGEWPEPWAVSLELGGIGPGYEERSDEATLAEQIPKLYDLVRSAEKE